MPLNVFLSWSGSRGRRLADALRILLPDVIQIASPWISSEDIDKGRRWGLEIATALSEAKIGIICLTPESLNSRWVLFEAGALAKTLTSAYVCPYLLGVETSQVQPPLADFQMTKSTKEDTLRLVFSLNKALDNPIDADRLRRAFDRCWPELEKTIKELEAEEVPTEKLPPARTEGDMLAEILERLRAIEKPNSLSAEVTQKSMFLAEATVQANELRTNRETIHVAALIQELDRITSGRIGYRTNEEKGKAIDRIYRAAREMGPEVLEVILTAAKQRGLWPDASL